MTDNSPTGRRKPVPHSRSFSLQMLTNPPTSAPLQQEMYTETLQPIRSPPQYSPDLDGAVLAPPLAYGSTASGSTAAVDEKPSGMTNGNARTFTGDAAIASTFSSTSLGRRDRGARAVSMPVRTSSPYESMFTFSTELPEDLSRTLVVPSPSPTPTSSQGHPMHGISPGASSRTDSPLPLPRVYSPEGMRMSYISDGRRSVSASNSPAPPRAARERPQAGTRKPSVLNTLGGWLDKRQESSKSNGSAR